MTENKNQILSKKNKNELLVILKNHPDITNLKKKNKIDLIDIIIKCKLKF